MSASGGNSTGTVREPVISKADFQFGVIKGALETLEFEELKRAADTIATLSGANVNGIEKYKKKEELRSFLVDCTKTLHDQDPEMLDVVRCFVDAMQRAHYIKLAR